MQHITKLTFTLFCVLLLAILNSGCRPVGDAAKLGPMSFTSYRDIPGITAEDIAAVAALREKHEHFTYAMMLSTEAFLGENGEIQGYAPLVCEWLTELFGIPFIPKLYSWNELSSGLHNGEIDFTGYLMPTDERRGLYFMTDAITQRPVRYFRLKDSEPLSEIAKTRTVRYALVRGTSTTDNILYYASEQFEPVLIDEHIEAYEMLKSGEVDAFISTGLTEAVFDEFGDVIAKDFMPLIYSTASIATNNSELVPIITVIQKALQNNASQHLYDLQRQGFQQYLRHKFLMRLTPEEREYIRKNPVIPLAAEFDNYPVSFYDFRQEKWQGVCMDVLKEIEMLTGLQFEIRHEIELSWDDLLQTLEDGETLIISELIRTTDRDGRFIWPENNFLRDHSALISKVEQPDVSLHEIWNVRVGLTAGNAHTEFFHRWFPDHKHTIEFPDQVSLLQALDRGEIDMAKNRNNLLLFLSNYHELAGYKSNYVFANVFESTFGFNKDAELLCSIVDKALELVDTQAISQRWLRRTYDYRMKLAEAQRPWMVSVIGLLLGILGLVTIAAITNRRKNKTMARQAAMLTAIYDSMPAIVFTKDLNNRYTSCNKKFEEEAKLTSGQLVGKDFEDIEVHDRTAAREFMDANLKVLRDRITVVSEGWYSYPNMPRRAKQIIRTPLIQAGKVQGLLGIAIDITERKLAEEAAHEANERAKVMVNTIPLCCCLITRSYECIDCNDEAARLFELGSQQEFIDNFAKLSPEYQPDGRHSMETLAKLIDRAFEGERFTGEWTHQLLDGTLIPAITTFERVKYGDDYVVFSYTQDRREQKRMETRIETIIHNIPGMVFQHIYNPPDYTYTFVSKGCEELTGYQAEELLGNAAIKFLDMVHPDDVNAIETLATKTLPFGLPFEFTFRLRMKDGTEKWVLERSRVTERNPDGSPYLIEGHYSDVTERWQLAMAEREREKMASRIETMIDNLPGMVFQCRYDPPEYTYTFLSKGCETILGYTAEELLGQPLIRLVHPDDVELIAQTDAESFPFGLPFETSYRIIRKDGSIKWVWERSRILETDADGNPTMLEGYYSDITERWQLAIAESERQQMSRRLESLIANLPGMVFQCVATFPDYPFTYVSEGSKGLLGYAPEELVGGPNRYMEMIHPEDFDAYDKKVQETLDVGLPFEHTGRFIMPDGSIKWILESCRISETNPDGTPYLLDGYCFDMTEHHRLEIAEIANQTKSAFLAMMSHEIRTPMNAIWGITEILMQIEGLPDEISEGLDRIYNSCDLLLGIINDILDFSKIEAGKMDITPAPYRIASLINDSVNLNMMRIGSNPIKFELQVDEHLPARLIGDELRIKQILNNLLSNAFKYTESGTVTLSITGEPCDGGVLLVLNVRDTGNGMTKEQLSKLFDEYSRFNQANTRAVEGTGLGLAITRRLITLMRGEISVESEPGVGSLFTVRLPQEAADDKVLGKELAASLQQFRLNHLTNGKRFRVVREPMPYGSVLIVDDMETNIYVAEGLMKSYGLQIDTATSGQETINKINAGNVYDIVFMDHMMPEMDGMETTRRLRDLGYKAPIVALTANAVAGQAEVFLENGFDAFISKPIDTRQLNMILNKLVRDKQSPEVIEAARRQKSTMKNGDADAADPQINPLLIESFIRDAGKALATLEDLWQGGNWESEEGMQSFTITVHGIKGSLGNIGESWLAELANTLETAGRNGNTDSILSSAPEFIQELRTLIEKFATNQEESGVDDDMAGLRGKLLTIQEMCANYDRKGALELLSAVKNCSQETREILDRIKEHVLHSEFEEAEREAAAYANVLAVVLED
ncbi:MAG: PAS domain-containing protein [Planctomycetaceae bacterium]|nr:PAS domain-containing protein [Planctomycetaceae bacterium]